MKIYDTRAIMDFPLNDISLNQKWVRVNEVIELLKSYEPEFGSDADWTYIYEDIQKLGVKCNVHNAN